MPLRVVIGDSIRVAVNCGTPVAATAAEIEEGMLRFQLPGAVLGTEGTFQATLQFQDNRLTGYFREPTTDAGLGYPRFVELTRR